MKYVQKEIHCQFDISNASNILKWRLNRLTNLILNLNWSTFIEKFFAALILTSFRPVPFDSVDEPVKSFAAYSIRTYYEVNRSQFFNKFDDFNIYKLVV